MKTIHWAALAAAIMAGGLLAGLRPAPAHEAHTGFTYDPWCCSGEDCSPLAGARVVAGADGRGQWLYKNRAGYEAGVDGITRFITSPDGETHVCIWLDSRGIPRLRCVYMPPNG